MSHQQLEDEKLRQEILNLQRGHSQIASAAPWITAAVAILGIVLTWWKQINEQRSKREEEARQREQDRQQRETAARADLRQREQDRAQHEAELAQRNEETRRRLEENFSTVATNLGNPQPAIEASATVSLLAFLKPELSAYHRQAYLLILANLKVKHDDQVTKLLTRLFERALRLVIHQGEEDRDLLLDFTNARLDTAELSGLDLTGVDFADASMHSSNLRDTTLFRARGYAVELEKATLSGAHLGEARLRKARCAKAHFHDADLVSARFEEADLRGAQFYRAKMQSAHLDKADIRGASFQGADVNDVGFKGAIVDPAALRSLSKAKNWRNARFDNNVTEQLESLSEAAVPL